MKAHAGQDHSDMEAKAEEKPFVMDNSGRGPLRVPGAGGIPLTYQLPIDQRFAHGLNEYFQTPAITAREQTMLLVMNVVTDKPDWHSRILTDEFAAQCYDEFSKQFELLSENTWSWCLAELRDKAVEYETSRFVRVLDVGSCVCKSGILGEQLMVNEFKADIAEYESSATKMSLNESLYHPPFHLLFYGRTPVLQGCETVSMESMFQHMKVAKPLPAVPFHIISDWRRMEEAEDLRYPLPHDITQSLTGFPSKYYWSTDFQPLPFDVSFGEGEGCGLHIESYINNLHPSNKCLYRHIKRIITAAIEPWNACLVRGRKDMKDSRGCPNVHDQLQRGRVPLRIITFGARWTNGLPKWCLSFNFQYCKWVQDNAFTANYCDATDEQIAAYNSNKRALAGLGIDTEDFGIRPIPHPDEETWALAEAYINRVEDNITKDDRLMYDSFGNSTSEDGTIEYSDTDDSTAEDSVVKNISSEANVSRNEPSLVKPDKNLHAWRNDAWSILLNKQVKLRYRVQHPEPGEAFPYDDWKVGRELHESIINMITTPHHGATPWAEPHHGSYTVRLQEEFRRNGLQVFVKFDLVEPYQQSDDISDKEAFQWHMEQLLNDRIVASAVFVYEVPNCCSPKLSFRQVTPMLSQVYRDKPNARKGCESDDYLAQILDNTSYSRMGIADTFNAHEILTTTSQERKDLAPFQELGSVELIEGRLIAFPNTVQHRIIGMDINSDEHERPPGTLSFMTIHLVDPNYRLCSTRNVPPLQFAWWADAVTPCLLSKGMPAELVAMVLQYCRQDWPLKADPNDLDQHAATVLA